MMLGGRYEILEHIGSGGMADVYKALCHRMNRYVAVKILRSEYNENDAFVRKFLAEAQATAALNHPNIVNVYDAGNENGIHYIVMELAEGMTLKRYIRRYGRLSARETVDFAIQIASGIQAAHAQNIVHRDIKPQNILVSDSGKIKVTDFGIAKVATGDTISSSTMGSVHYLSPEQARGGYSDRRSDIYSLGITMYEMATGRVPFDGDNSVTIALMQIQDPIKPPRDYFPDIPASLENIILKCTMKHPEERYQNAGELIEDLQRVFDSPDGNYVYINPLVDDSPTIARTDEEIAAVKQSLTGQKGKEYEDPLDTNGKEDELDDEQTNKKFEKLILVITTVLGIALAAIIIYLVASSSHLFHIGGSSTEMTTETTAEERTTEAVTEQVAVPAFTKLTKEEAQKRAEKHSLQVQFQVAVTAMDVPEEQLIVIKQNFARGDKVDVNTMITLTLGPDESAQSGRVLVPPLINYKEDEAVEALEKVGLKTKIIYAHSDTVKEGYVIKQNPTAGTEVDLGFTITITVSRGLEQVKVPSLSGLSQEAAEKELNYVGLKLGSVSSDYSGSVGVGEVIDQDIPSGTSVEKGTAVSITISLGEQETYHYEGTAIVSESPFGEEETGSIKLVLQQEGQREKTIFSDAHATAGQFPLEVDFSTLSDQTANIIVYVNGSEYDRFTVALSAVAD